MLSIICEGFCPILTSRDGGVMVVAAIQQGGLLTAAGGRGKEGGVGERCDVQSVKVCRASQSQVS